jgi:hypothetical protein
MAWRWSFGISAGLLAILALFEFVRTQPLSNANLLFLHSGNPLLKSAALMNLLQSSVPRLLRFAAVLAPVLAVLWAFASALGRAATLSVIRPQAHMRFRSILGLGFLRAALALVALVALFGVLLFPAAVSAQGTRFLALCLTLAVLFVWSWLSWVLNLASLPAAAGQDTLSAIDAALRLYRGRFGAFSAAGTWFGLLHLVIAVGAFMAAGFAVSMAAVSVGLAIVGLAGIAVAYCALADFLKIAHLAAYSAIADES